MNKQQKEKKIEVLEARLSLAELNMNIFMRRGLLKEAKQAMNESNQIRSQIKELKNE